MNYWSILELGAEIINFPVMLRHGVDLRNMLSNDSGEPSLFACRWIDHIASDIVVSLHTLCDFRPQYALRILAILKQIGKAY